MKTNEDQWFLKSKAVAPQLLQSVGLILLSNKLSSQANVVSHWFMFVIFYSAGCIQLSEVAQKFLIELLLDKMLATITFYRSSFVLSTSLSVLLYRVKTFS